MRRKWAVLTAIVLVGSFVGALGGTANASTTFTVNQTGDQYDFSLSDNVCDADFFLKGPQCTLRAAIGQANATAGADTITFSIGASGGAQTISPGSALPTITEAVTIDATTQPGFVRTPLITLSGVSAGFAPDGLTLAAGASTVKGLIIDSFGHNGIWITAGGGDTITTNWIGIDASSADKGNGAYGIRIDGTGANTIGAAGSARNVISGNSGGIDIAAGSAGNVVQGNLIGTNAAGYASVGNSTQGIEIYGASATIGGAGAAGNLISGNGGAGVEILGSAATNVSVRSNAIGTNVFGTSAIPNGGPGVIIINAPGNLVSGNEIAGNTESGVWVSESSPGLAPSNVIIGNTIGTSGTGPAIPNFSGVLIAANNTTVGGTAAGEGNVISGNTRAGITLDATGTKVLGNVIGTTGDGSQALPNGAGIDVSVGPNTIGGTTGTTPGGACTGACNVVSGNSGAGVWLKSGATQVTVSGNLIGLDGLGTTAIPNGTGIDVQGSSNIIGGTAVGSGNVISGNSGTGVLIDGSPPNPLPTLNLVQGNRIGTTPGGTAALGNSQGVAIFGATKNTIGGTAGTTPGGACTGACNVISGNMNRGIEISNPDTVGNVISGNFVGTDATGTTITALGNGGNGGGPGIRIETSALATVIGGTTSSARNVISGSSGEGIDIEGALKTKVLGNYIGTDTKGNVDLGNGEVLATKEPGITVFGGSATVIGGKGGARNLISGNGEAGVLIDGAAKSTKVQGNLLGTTANGSTSLGNGGDGVKIANGFKSMIGGTTVGLGNTIAFNAGAGVSVILGTGNAIRQNSIRSNVGLGIDLAPVGVNPNDTKDPDLGPNLRQNYPVITSASSSGGSTVISGTFNSTVNTTNFILEFFSSPTCDAFGFGEGKTFLGLLAAVATDVNGNASWTVTLPVTLAPGSVITATATDFKANSSEFSACRVST